MNFDAIPISVVIATHNEEYNLPRCLDALQKFDEVIIFDSNLSDKTVEIAREYGARVEIFEWNGAYPKKRQYFLDNIQTKHDYIFFVDADEMITANVLKEIRQLDFSCTGYFVKGQYNWRGKVLRYGLKNNKLALFDRRKIMFPVIDDVGVFCMGEMEGHYQPVLRQEYQREKIGALNNSLVHFAYEDQGKWIERHQRYAAWEAGMIKANAYPKEDHKLREALKYVFRHIPYRGFIAFVHSYILKFGFLDGRAGWQFARSRYQYYQMVANALKTNKVLGR